VENQIEVLPTSPMTTNRAGAFIARFMGCWTVPLWSASVPSIHLIVKNGHVTLEGVVDSEADKNLAGSERTACRMYSR